MRSQLYCYCRPRSYGQILWGKRIAYLGYYDADFHAATESLAGTNPRYDERVAADIKAIRDQVDWVVVNYHWGVELAEYPGTNV
ncbi:MAG: CapA family protein [Planktothrix agardhii KL2]|nr:CapA family protein [Planktothrix agardhii]MBG0745645.1 CapA family protein [Planktothrix agardhii KL2]